MKRFTVIALIVCLALVATTAPLFSGPEVERAQTVVFDLEGGKPADPENWNPYSAGRPRPKGLAQALTEPLFLVNVITGEFEPWQALSMTSNEDSSVWTLTLREGVKWSDGEDFSADDVIFTVEMIKNSPDLNTPIEFGGVDVKKVDDYTVEFTLEEPNPRFQLTRFGGTGSRAFYVVPEHIWSEQEDPVTFRNYDPDKGWPVFTGAYTLDSFTDTIFNFVRDDDWWGAEVDWRPLPAPEKLVWVFWGPEETRAAATAKNDLDSMALASPGAFETLRGLNDEIIAWTDEPPYGWIDVCSRNLEFNHLVPPWDDPEMRWAVDHAINRDQIVDIAYSGMAYPSRNFLPIFPTLERYVDLIDFEKYPVQEYDPELTKSIFESKGWEMNPSTGYYEKDGQELGATVVNFEDAIITSLNGVVVEQLQAVGINAVQDVQIIPNFIDNLLNGQFELFIFFVACGSQFDPWMSLDAYSVRHLRPEGEPADGFYSNTPRWSGDVAEKYSEVVAEMAAVPPGDPEMDELFAEAMDYWYQDLPSVPLVQNPIIWPFNQTYWTNWPSAENSYIQPDMAATTTSWIIHNLEPAE